MYLSRRDPVLGELAKREKPAATLERRKPEISGSREVLTQQTREVKDAIDAFSSPEISRCPYCASKDIIKRGKRKKKLELRQRYQCNSCKRSFVPQTVKGKQYPLKMILDGLCYYNTGHSFEQSSLFLKEEYGVKIAVQVRALAAIRVEIIQPSSNDPDRASLSPAGL